MYYELVEYSTGSSSHERVAQAALNATAATAAAAVHACHDMSKLNDMLLLLLVSICPAVLLSALLLVCQIGWATIYCPFTAEEGVGDAPDSYAVDGKRLRLGVAAAAAAGGCWQPAAAAAGLGRLR